MAASLLLVYLMAPSKSGMSFLVLIEVHLIDIMVSLLLCPSMKIGILSLEPLMDIYMYIISKIIISYKWKDKIPSMHPTHEFLVYMSPTLVSSMHSITYSHSDYTLSLIISNSLKWNPLLSWILIPKHGGLNPTPSYSHLKV